MEMLDWEMEMLDWEIDWTVDHWHMIKYQALKDGLATFLKRIPRSKWNNKHPESSATLLHYACMYKNGVIGGSEIVTLSKFIDVHSTIHIWTPIHIACNWNIPRNVELILAAGFNDNLECLKGHSSPLFFCKSINDECSQILISNGYRWDKEDFGQRSIISRDMINLQKAVIQCRDVIVVLLGLKKRKQVLGKLDRFLIQQELAVAIWSTRRHGAK